VSDLRIIVLDDDPTGSQTVHGCLLLTRWDPATLAEGLADDAPLFFVLTNTRGMDAAAAAAVTRAACANLRTALAAHGRPVRPLLVSRSDSTLRGHYPVETDAIAAELGPFDAHFLVPAFLEGGRITRDSVHYLIVDGREVPVHETEFARDRVFGYSTSYLPDYVAEKTGGRVPASAVARFLLADVRGDCLDRLTGLSGNACCVVDAEAQADLDRFCDQVLTAVAGGKRFLFRSAASLLTSLARLPPQPVRPEAFGAYARPTGPGAVVVGSHVGRTTAQLEVLLRQPDVAPLEVDVTRIDRDREALLAETLAAAARAHGAGRTAVVFTSRAEVTCADPAARLAFGARVADLLVDVVRGLPEGIGYLIAKGGITANETLSRGLSLRSSRVLGQVLPGCSVVRCPGDHPRFPELPVVIFPGNVGDREALARADARMAGRPERASAAG
jgi:uncharacterized protein YgbK (DUF1537 family)